MFLWPVVALGKESRHGYQGQLRGYLEHYGRECRVIDDQRGWRLKFWSWLEETAWSMVDLYSVASWKVVGSWVSQDELEDDQRGDDGKKWPPVKYHPSLCRQKLEVEQLCWGSIASKQQSLAEPDFQSASGATLFSIRAVSQRGTLKFIQMLEEFKSIFMWPAQSELHFRSFHLKRYILTLMLSPFPLFVFKVTLSLIHSLFNLWDVCRVNDSIGQVYISFFFLNRGRMKLWIFKLFSSQWNYS